MGKKFTFVSLILFSLLSALPLQGQSNQIVSQVVGCVRSGSASCLAPHLSSRTELTVPGARSSFAPSQARYVLQKFFDQNPPGSIKVTSNVNRGTTVLVIAEYRSGSNVYNVNLFFKQGSSGFKLEKMYFARK